MIIQREYISHVFVSRVRMGCITSRKDFWWRTALINFCYCGRFCFIFYWDELNIFASWEACLQSTIIILEGGEVLLMTDFIYLHI